MASDNKLLDMIKETSQYIKQRVNNKLPKTAIILGTGLGAVVDHINIEVEIPYGEVPNFPVSTVQGHKGRLIFGTLGNKYIMAMQGRFHYYEGYTMEEVTYPVRVFSELGIGRLLVSNAAGAVNADYQVGDLMVITDHINFMPNPLIGPNKEEFGPRFPDMTETYSRRLRQKADTVAAEMGIVLRHGVYVAGTGPTYETPAEYRMYHIIGGDACGMSTVPEVIVARHCGMEVFGISVITNQSNDLGVVAGGTDGNDHLVVNDENDVVLQADRAADRMTGLFTRLITPNA